MVNTLKADVKQILIAKYLTTDALQGDMTYSARFL